MKVIKLDLPNSLDDLVNNHTTPEIEDIFHDIIISDEKTGKIFEFKEKNLYIFIKIIGFQEERELIYPYPTLLYVGTREISKAMVGLVESLLKYNNQILSKFEKPDNFYIDLKKHKICTKRETN